MIFSPGQSDLIKRMHKERLFIIDIWITILMFIVIVGHCMFPFRPEWYPALHKWIYSFHMGNFFFISGFLFAYTYRPICGLKEYWMYERKKLVKFGYPFLMLGSAFTLLSVYQQHLGMEGFIKGIFALFLDPTSSHAIYLWFIYILCAYYLLAPCCVINRRLFYLILTFSLILIFFPLPRLFSGHLFSRFLLFYMLGIFCYRKIDLLQRVPVWAGGVVTIFFAYISIFQADKVPYVISCLLSIPSFFLLSWVIHNKLLEERLKGFIQVISQQCYAIYLYQMLFLNLLAIIFEHLPHGTATFILFLILGEALSIFGSILVSKAIHYTLSHISDLIR